METISYADFSKLDLRVAKILAAERVEGADKLLKLTISLGAKAADPTTPNAPPAIETRTLAAGIAQHYSPEELVGKKIIVLANIQPRTLRGIESQGMLLAASTDDKSEVVLLTVDKNVPEGSGVS